MNTLIVKVGATGDVVRTTPLLSRLKGQVTWLTASKNTVLLEGLNCDLRCFSWEDRERALDTHYDLCINLEDTLDVAQFLKTVRCGEIFGAYVDSDGSLRYTANSERWFDLSLISAYGKMRADKLKFQNRQTYQELVFEGLGFRFAGETIFAAGTDRDRAIRRCCHSSRCRADLADEKVGLLRRAKAAA